MEIKRSLDPVYDKDTARILILGSMPGEESLRRQEYYGYPRNQFWRIISELLGCELPSVYGGKISMIKDGGIALWDVIGSCRREGSLDTNIRDEEPNSLFGLIEELPGLRAVFFNGQKAGASFKKHFGFASLNAPGLSYEVLPSTSPANTASYDDKLKAWRVITAYLG